ncbi:Transcription initiation factor TFIID subunit 7-like [Oopsacas minuta]|uniref:Transcription initiation factor TFIID subunit 7-like n=1 Tax=Oopsacas minuta TaxID=111878 RepID=A0AAV7K6C2_9METZ|nr:Transcription initiation factor TFIID subunit 7-like [Oopsacas minuta]
MTEQEYGIGQLEQHCLLRLPPHVAQQVAKSITTDTLEERLQIKIGHDGRNCKLRFDDNTLYGRAVDLPCIIDVNKTLDKKTLYKSGNIGQMIVCSEEPFDMPCDDINDLTLKQRNQLQRRYQWKHGITPPLKNIRKKRFRKTALKKLIDSPEIESEVRRLLKEDAEAVNVEFELLTDEEARPPGTPATPKELMDISSAEMSLNQGQLCVPVQSTPPASGINLIGEVSSSDEEDDKNNPLVNLGEVLEELPEPIEDIIEEQVDLIQDKIDTHPKIEIDNSVQLKLEEDLDKMSKELKSLRVKLNKQKSRIDGTTNPFLKERFTRELNEIEEEEQKLIREESEIRNKLSEIQS